MVFFSLKISGASCLCEIERCNMNHLSIPTIFSRQEVNCKSSATNAPGEFNSGLEKKCLGDHINTCEVSSFNGC